MIAYMIQMHQRFDQALNLFDLIYHPANQYFFVVDSAVDLPNIFKDKINSYKNTQIFNDLPGTWGGASLVASTLETMARALKFSPNWQAFINLSGLDIPLKSQSHIMAVLAELRNQGKSSFIADFGKRAFIHDILMDKTASISHTVKFRSDTTFQLCGATKEFFETNGGPIKQPHLRTRVHVSENVATKTLTLRPLFDIEAQHREEFFKRHEFHFGRQWFILDREACEFAVQSELSASLFETLKSVMIPDECFFQTLFRAAGEKAKNIVFNNNFRFYLGEPVALQNKFVGELKSTTAFFARKYYPEADQTNEIREFIQSLQ